MKLEIMVSDFTGDESSIASRSAELLGGKSQGGVITFVTFDASAMARLVRAWAELIAMAQAMRLDKR